MRWLKTEKWWTSEEISEDDDWVMHSLLGLLGLRWSDVPEIPMLGIPQTANRPIPHALGDPIPAAIRDSANFNLALVQAK